MKILFKKATELGWLKVIPGKGCQDCALLNYDCKSIDKTEGGDPLRCDRGNDTYHYKQLERKP